MAYQRHDRYEYGTSPRKIEPEYRKVPKKYPKKSTMVKTRKQVQKKKNDQFKVIMYVVLVFLAVFAISYRNSQIDEAFSKVESLKEEYQSIQKINEQVEVSIENSLNLNNVEQSAKELLGMQKLSNKQTVYVSLPKKDYIETEVESIELQKNENFFEKIVNKIKDIF